VVVVVAGGLVVGGGFGGLVVGGDVGGGFPHRPRSGRQRSCPPPCAEAAPAPTTRSADAATDARSAPAKRRAVTVLARDVTGRSLRPAAAPNPVGGVGISGCRS
jgi:hypothetical protein